MIIWWNCIKIDEISWKWSKMSRNWADFRPEMSEDMQKYAKSAEICKELQILRRKLTAACGSGEGPKPRGAGLPLAQHRKIIGIPWVFEGCSLPRQRPAEAVLSCPAEAGRDGPKCVEIAQKLQISAEISRNCKNLLQNRHENEQKLIRNDQNWSELTKWSNYWLINN